MAQITGTSGKDKLIGTAENDILRGLGGNDILSGGAGQDEFDGGTGHDTVDYSSINATTHLDIDLTLGRMQIKGRSFVEKLISIESAIGGKGHDIITGNAGNNRLEGKEGDDSLIGGAGDDTLVGGAGRDSYNGGLGSDRAVFSDVGSSTGLNIDLVKARMMVVDNITFTESMVSIENVSGGQGNDFIKGDGANNRLDGQGGNDTVIGGDGDDTLAGGAGNDTLRGSSGNDTLMGGLGVDRFEGGEGSDTVIFNHTSSALDIDLSLNQAQVKGTTVTEFLGSIEHATGGRGHDSMRGDSSNNRLDGSAGNDTIVGGGGDDTLIGGTGNDTLKGGSGADRLIGGGGTDSFDGGNGSDTVDYSSVGIGLDIDLAFNRMIGGDSVEQLINIENVIGGRGNDTITGDDHANRLTGGAGNDRFSFDDTNGADIITDFRAGEGAGDQIDLRLNTVLRNFADVQAAAKASGSDTVIGLGHGDQLTLIGVAKSDLHADDFLF